MKYLILYLISFALASVHTLPSEVTGTVKSVTGKPLADVQIIYSRSLQDDFAITDSNGFFRIPHHNGVIFFQCPGYRPLTKIVTSSENRLNVVLEDSAASEWVLPDCSELKESVERVGFSLRLPVPKEAVLHKGSDIDYSYFSVSYGPERIRVWLRGIGQGPFASLGVPQEKLILNSAEFQERAYRGGGIDMRGRLGDGTYWRFVGRLGEQIDYQGVSREAADYFDRILDKACLKANE